MVYTNQIHIEPEALETLELKLVHQNFFYTIQILVSGSNRIRFLGSTLRIKYLSAPKPIIE